MLHHYGKVFPKIYASPIKPRKSRANEDGGITYLDYIQDDLEVNNPKDVTCSNSVVGTATKETQTDFGQYSSTAMHSSQNILKKYSPKIQFTPEEDLRLLEAAEIHKRNSSLKPRYSWADIKFTANLSQAPNQIRLRHNKLIEKKQRSMRLSRKKPESIEVGKENAALPGYEVLSYVCKVEKIERIAAAMNKATQREYFDNSFFERLPQTIGTKELWRDVRLFYLQNCRVIKGKLSEDSLKRFYLNSGADINEKWSLYDVYASQRTGREKLIDISNQKAITTRDNFIIRDPAGQKKLKNKNGAGTDLFMKNDPQVMSLQLEWENIVKYISQKEIFIHIPMRGFWDNLAKRVALIPGKNANDLEEDFYRIIVPHRNEYDWIKLPGLNLLPSSKESKIVIFHEVNRTGLINESIQQLLGDGIISDDISLNDWFVEFALAINQTNDLFFMSKGCEFIVVKESVRVQIARDVL